MKIKIYPKCLLFFSAIIFNEFIADYLVIYKCNWPTLGTANNKEVRVMIMADTHLLGPFRGHWLDKLYREWHMKNAFGAAIKILHPDVIFVLGDLFDEGDFVNDQQFKQYVRRFQSHFQTPSGTPIISAVGNHDIGFHYKMQNYLTTRFEDNFNNTGVKLYTFNDIHFVVINSMAMENDGCDFCDRTLNELHEISKAFACLQKGENCPQRIKLFPKDATFSQPIIMQHFPTYRASDDECENHDAIKIEQYRENWEVLSKRSTDLLGRLLNPRVLFAGHSHDYCLSKSRLGVSEYTVASFNWRNKINPSFLLITTTAKEFAANKCKMLTQTFVFSVYIGAVIIFACLCVMDIVKIYLNLRKMYLVIFNFRNFKKKN